MGFQNYVHGYMYEWRGSSVYGFCDKGCKAIVRRKLWQLHSAMNAHLREHEGQARLPYPEPEPAPGAAPGFPF